MFKMKIKIISVFIIFIMVSSGLVVYGLMQNNTNNSVPVKYNSYTTTGSLPSFINQTYKISDIAIHNMTITLKNSNLVYSNYSTEGNFGNYTTVIVSRHNQWNTPVLFYVATNDTLMAYFIDTHSYMLLHSWYVSPMMNMSTNSNAVISFYQNMTTGKIMYIFASAEYSSTDTSPYIQMYDFVNNSYYFYKESNITAYFHIDEIINNNADMITYYNNNLYVINAITNKFLKVIPLTQENAFDLVKQNVFEQNYVVSGVSYYDFYIYNPSTNDMSYYNFSSSYGMSGATADYNNAPVFVKFYSNGTVMVSGVENARPNFDAIYVEIDFFSDNTAKIVFQTQISTTSKGGFDSNSDGVLTYISNTMIMPAQLNIYLSDSTYANYSFPFMNLGNITFYYNSSVQKYVNTVYANSELYSYEYNLIDDAGLNDSISGAVYSSNSLDLYWIGNLNLNSNTNTNNTSVIKYSVDFKIYGLPQNTSWAVYINNQQYVSDNDSLIVYLPNGTYTPIFVIPNGYIQNDIGIFTVNTNMTYFIQVSQSPYLFLQNNLSYIIVFIFIMMILIIAIAVRNRRGE